MRGAWAAVAGAALLVSVGGAAAPGRRGRPDAGTAAHPDAGATWEDVKRNFEALRHDVADLQEDYERNRARAAAEADGGSAQGAVDGGRADAGR